MFYIFESHQTKRITMKEKTSFTFHLTKDLHERIAEKAKSLEGSVASYIRNLVLADLRAQK